MSDRTTNHPIASPGRYVVFVDDNFHYHDEEARYRQGAYDSYEEALAACKAIVERSLQELFTPGMHTEELLGQYQRFGDDPWIAPDPETPSFSAWTYAQERAEELCMTTRQPPELTTGRDDAPV